MSGPKRLIDLPKHGTLNPTDLFYLWSNPGATAQPAPVGGSTDNGITLADLTTAVSAGVTGSIAAETARATAAEATLTTNLANEATTRATADTILQTYLSVLVPSTSAITGYVSGSPQAVASLNIPAGTWFVSGDVVGMFAPSSAYAPQISASLSSFSYVMDFSMSNPTDFYAPSTSSAVSLSANAPGIILETTGGRIYLLAQGTFANGTLKCCGSMIARRII